MAELAKLDSALATPTKGGGFKAKLLLGREMEDEREEVLLTKNSAKRVTAIATPPPYFM
jgi:hypothetical protein